MKYFGGIEGGATHSHLIICQENGKFVSEARGLGTNPWQLGTKEASTRIADMVQQAKKSAGIPLDIKLTSLGLSISGCEQEDYNRKFEAEIQKSFPNISESYFICSDTMGSIYTASGKGGLVVIAGTGSNTLLRNPDGTTYSCGGWGHILGDEASAWYISQHAIKTCFDHMDNFKVSPYPIDCTWKLIKDHFSIENRLDFLSHCYGKFEKCFYAGLCKKLAEAANHGDALCQMVFKDAGCDIARSIQAVLPNVSEDLIEGGNLNVLCVGSVWKSWGLLRDGFLQEMSKTQMKYSLSLVLATKSVAYGACYLGADNIKYPLPRNYADNTKTFYCYTGENMIKQRQ